MLLTLLLSLPLVAPQAQEDPRAVARTTYEAAFAAQDAESLAALWRARPELVLSTFDSDLEAGLAAWEQQGEGHAARTAEHFQRAVWGAEIASDALDAPIFGDYANAFAGWNDDQRKRFRRGQAAFGEANKALRGGDAALALARGVECRELALALGDWWGTAMGLSVEGAALAATNRHAEAVVAFSRARLLNRQLGLFGSEYRTLLGLVDALIMSGDYRRAIRAADDALVMARKNDDAENLVALLTSRKQAEIGAGDIAAAEATDVELEQAKVGR